jgi:hypothetical protein
MFPISKSFFKNSGTLAKLGMGRSHLTHLTDLEGNWSYMQKWVNRSNGIGWSTTNKNQLVFKLSQSDREPAFVYGGDLCDKGPGDLRIGNALVQFKKDHPQKVHLLAGNREIKCRRFTYELDETHIRERLLKGPSAFWKKNSSPRDYLLKQMKVEGQEPPSEQALRRHVDSLSVEECQTIYLQWMLNETMGCASVNGKPNTFEYRRLELAEMSGLKAEQISDRQVTRSFIESVDTGGIISEYLKNSSLGVVIGETLFLHGAVTPQNMGFIPGMSDTSPRVPDARNWIDGLNQWYKQQISDWDSHRTEDAIQPPGHKELDRYVLFNPRSVVTTNWYQQDKLAPIPQPVVDYLNRSGIYRVVTGHQPFSDFPLVIRSPSLEVIVGDTGYSDPNHPTDNRGKAIHNIEFYLSDGRGHTVIDGVRRNGNSSRVTLPSRETIARGFDIDIGHFTEDGRLIRMDEQGELVSSQLDGFAVDDKPITASMHQLK